MNNIQPYPLNWPPGYLRTKQPAPSRFGRWNNRVTIAKAVAELYEQLRLMGISNEKVVMTSNLKLRRDGLPHSDQAEPKDSGVAIWWTLPDGTMQVLPSDRWRRVADNIYAAALAIEAMRGIDRWVSGQVQQRAFSGLAALPYQEGWRWWEVLGTEAHAPTNDVIKAYNKLRSQLHPDKPTGNEEEFKKVVQAYADFRKERNL